MRQRNPGIPIVVEETDNPQIQTSSFYVVDPLDGTWIYAFGNNEWSVHVPLEPKQKEILKELGVVYKN